MARQNFRPFDGLSKSPAARDIYAMAIRASGDLVFMMGQSGYDLEGKFASAGDAAAQARQACTNIKMLLNEAGGTPQSLCKLTVYMTDVAFRQPVYLAIEESFAGATFCRTGMIVQNLGPPELLVEIDAFAVLPSRAGASEDTQ
jgi:enamine deaminase RidA (YjgF/YER057c/UK114 family)